MEQNDSKYLPELMAEKDSIDPSFEHAVRLISQGENLRIMSICFVITPRTCAL